MKRRERLIERIQRTEKLWNNKPLKMHNSFWQKKSNGNYFLTGSWCQPCLVQAYFLLVAWKGSMLLFRSRSGKGTRSLFSLPLNGRNSSLLFWLALLYSPSPFYLDNFFLGPTPFLPFAFLDKISSVHILFPLPFGQKNFKSNFNFTQIF